MLCENILPFGRNCNIIADSRANFRISALLPLFIFAPFVARYSVNHLCLTPTPDVAETAH